MRHRVSSLPPSFYPPFLTIICGTHTPQHYKHTLDFRHQIRGLLILTACIRRSSH